MLLTTSMAAQFLALALTAADTQQVEPSAPVPVDTRLVSLTLIVRHGDRSPLTPALSREYWRSLLPSEAELAAAGEGTRVLREAPADGPRAAHSAVGDGVYGTLTRLGLAQMRALGADLRRELVAGASAPASQGLLSPSLDPSELELFSTDFPRTVQSLQVVARAPTLPAREPRRAPADHRSRPGPAPHPPDPARRPASGAALRALPARGAAALRSRGAPAHH